MAHTDIDALIREEKRLEATETHREAWAEGVAAGIEPEIVAEAALVTALGEYLRSEGEAAALALVERMKAKIISGEIGPAFRHH